MDFTSTTMLTAQLNLLLSFLKSFLSALSLMLLVAPASIKMLRIRQKYGTTRDYVPKSHLKKVGTPSMGGLLTISISLCVIFFWNPHFCLVNQVMLLTLIGFGFIGFLDDYLKLDWHRKKGLTIKRKYLLQSILSFFIAVLIYRHHPVFSYLFIGSYHLYLGWLFIVWAYFIIIGSSNAFNLTDGLDGLATWQIVIITLSLSLFIALEHDPVFKKVDLLIACSAVLGTHLGFLWFNAYPAKVFMGDTGSLSFGALLAVFAILIRKEILFAVIVGIPVMETVSVILQIIFFKWKGQRLFLIAPFHHHLELKGWKEQEIVRCFTIIATVLAVLACSFNMYC